MAELIDKGVLMEKLNVFNDRVHGNEHFLYGIETAKELLEDTPTVTEAEIRAKAISDFLKALEELTKKNWIDHLEYGITWADLESVAEQLKECE